MNTSINLICTDFDGTIFAEFEHRPIPDVLVKQIAEFQQAGGKWIINTGRDLSSLLESLGRSRVSIHPDYLVVVERDIYVHNGASYDGFRRWNDACLADHNNLFAHVRSKVPDLSTWITNRHRATLYEDAFSPFCLIAESNEEADSIHVFLEEFAAQIPGLSVVRNDVYMRFCHSTYNKGTALSEICRMLGVSAKETFVAGDHFNDLPMLQRKRAAWLAAPANAIAEVQETVREQGGYVSPFSAGDGVADALRQCLTNGLSETGATPSRSGIEQV